MPADAQEAMVKVVTFERRVAELQKMLQEKSQISTDSQEQVGYHQCLLTGLSCRMSNHFI